MRYTTPSCDSAQHVRITPHAQCHPYVLWHATILVLHISWTGSRAMSLVRSTPSFSVVDQVAYKPGAVSSASGGSGGGTKSGGSSTDGVSAAIAAWIKTHYPFGESGIVYALTRWVNHKNEPREWRKGFDLPVLKQLFLSLSPSGQHACAARMIPTAQSTLTLCAAGCCWLQQGL
jgi:hypothetical protein